MDEKPKIDRRVLRTRQILRQSLMALVKEKGYENVSVEEITQRADIGRATFYLHYHDKEELLLDEFSEMARERVLALSAIPFSQWLPALEDGSLVNENKVAPPFLLIFQHVRENAELYQILLQNQSSNRIAEKIRAIVTQSINDFVQAKVASDDPIPLFSEIPVDLLAAFFYGALVSSIAWWLENPGISIEEMTRMFQRMFVPGARRAMVGAA
ncbi:MAG: TetR/AcrR family transcriptional regulator [Anaerolineales bacterium]